MLPTGRTSGILLPLFSLRSREDFGIGDFGALEGLFAWMGAARQKLLMLLPLLPTAPNDSSPYATRSAFGLNPLFIDLHALPEFAEAGGEAALSEKERSELEEARRAPRIRYDLVFALKGRALRRAFDRFVELHWSRGDARAEALRRYQDEQAGWLTSFTLFSAISFDQQLRPWWEWPEPLRDRHPQALAQEAERLWREVLFQSWLQWVAEAQWEKVRALARSRGIFLCGDEPFITGQDSADAWANPGLLRRDGRLGVPPDDFSATGQDWGLPYYDFAAMEQDGWGWLRFRARRSAAYYDLRRVDHAVGYFRQWVRDARSPTGRFIPPDEDSQRALGERLFRILSEQAGIIAEDLGVIPQFVRETLTRLGLPGYRVMRWERDDGVYRNPHQFPALSVATTGTHDTETLCEWWERSPDWEREATARAYPELHGLSPLPREFTPQVHEALLAAAESSGSQLCLLPWQDVLGTRDRVNLPGSIGDSNWSYRMSQWADALCTDPETQRAADRLARLTGAAGR